MLQGKRMSRNTAIIMMALIMIGPKEMQHTGRVTETLAFHAKEFFKAI
jgi:hypothetical protein